MNNEKLVYGHTDLPLIYLHKWNTSGAEKCQMSYFSMKDQHMIIGTSTSGSPIFS